ncbi:hypothetical protein [Rahnella aceris]|uniref:hypothetical protein n=1 Tax=Rahnella sp. (strain Y9602) TaxID=2703885 RepID=UPI00366410EA
MQTFSGGTWLCAALHGCATLSARLPPLTGFIAFAVVGGISVFIFCLFHDWRPALFSVILVGLTDFLLYVWLDAGQWAPRETTVAVMLSLFPIVISLPFEEMFVSRYPRFRYAVHLMTPVYSVGFTLLIWTQATMHG